MATARKLPSGKWRVLIFDYTDKNNKRRYKSFTANTKKEAEHLASTYKIENSISNSDIRFGTALENYIKNRSNVLSVTTIRGYRTIQNTRLKELEYTPIDKLDNERIQAFINSLTDLKPKTIRNIYALLVSTIHSIKPNLHIKVTLPKKNKDTKYLPTKEDIEKILEYVKDTDMEIPILLAIYAPLRRGEICALDMEHIKGNTIHIEYALGLDENKTWHKKIPKTIESNRKIELPNFIIDKINAKGKITVLSPSAINAKFPRILKKLNIPHFRFHDLRHYSASLLHALNIPNKYIMARGGWATDNVLKNIYQHTLSDINAEINTKLNSHFESMQKK